MFLKDALALDRASIREIDKDGHLHVELTPISKANVCPYSGSEIPEFKTLGLDPGKVYQLYRAPDELEKGAKTFDGKPLLFEHKPTSAGDHQKDITVGSVMNPVFEAPYLKARLVVWPGEAIDAIEDESKCELSCGYRYRADMTPGTSPDGERYDGVMRDIIGNHVALVEEGRAGPDVVVGDSKHQEPPNMSKIVLSRKASVAQGALLAYLAPKLATDAKIDLAPSLAKTTAKNFKASRAALAADVKKITTGKLAKDATIESADLEKVLDVIEMIEPSEEEPDTVADADPDGNLRKFIKDRKMSKDAVQKACDEMGEAEDADLDETEEEKKAREAKEAKDKKARDKAAKDKAAADAEKAEGEKVDKKAMDAAIKSATKQAVDEANATQRAIRDAEREVRGHVGDIVIAHDSAEAVYRTALATLGEDEGEIKDLPLGALRAILKRIPLPGARPTRIAADSAPNKGFDERFPDAKRIRAI